MQKADHVAGRSSKSVQNEKRNYPSKYSPGSFICPHQYIVEIVCENNARRNNRDLPLRFWELDEWSQYFRSQTRRCCELISKYSDTAVLAVVRGRNLYSLHARWIDELIEKEYKKELAKPKVKYEEIELITNSTGRPSKEIDISWLD